MTCVVSLPRWRRANDPTFGGMPLVFDATRGGFPGQVPSRPRHKSRSKALDRGAGWYPAHLQVCATADEKVGSANPNSSARQAGKVKHPVSETAERSLSGDLSGEGSPQECWR